jgi:hypothetical protein
MKLSAMSLTVKHHSKKNSNFQGILRHRPNIEDALLSSYLLLFTGDLPAQAKMINFKDI